MSTRDALRSLLHEPGLDKLPRDLRLSVGLEEVEELWEDLSYALTSASAP